MFPSEQTIHACSIVFDVTLEFPATRRANSLCLWGGNLTHWGWDKMATIFQMTFWNAFSLMKMYEFWLKFHQSLFIRAQLTIFQPWFRPGDKPLYEPIMVRLPMHICITWPQWVKWNPFGSIIGAQVTILTHWGLVTGGTMPLPEPMLTYHQ